MPENNRANVENSKLHRSRAARLQSDSANNKRESSQRNPRFLLFILIGFCLLFIFSYTSRLIEYSRSQAMLEQWEERIDDASEHQSKLVAQREFVYSDDYVDKVAREDLGLAKPGDQVVVIIPDSEVNEGADTVAAGASNSMSTDPSLLPIWQQWFELFKQNSSVPFSL